MADSKDFLIENGVLKRYKGKSKNVVVPEGVTAIGKRAFSNKQFIESVIIPEGVIVIKTEAFVFCDNLRVYTKVINGYKSNASLQLNNL